MQESIISCLCSRKNSIFLYVRFLHATMILNFHIIVYVLSLSFLSNVIHVASKVPYALVLYCDSSNIVNDSDGRAWDPDAKCQAINLSLPMLSSMTPSLSSQVSYMIARIFRFEAAYQFSLQNSTYCII